ncbi:EF-hand domain pair [Neorhodopirellula lusitana]|uniref:EF-hand domain pair n=2 Tax=Neorhodopirellula lusitana TaxID=445327 RepID=A0ABY1Q0N1_9BACT|nr:YHYH protein [Neorhodopirellula lusitana]SMP55705.1 EF-hand domain pair [Neorhodopirellula lusitana]
MKTLFYTGILGLMASMANAHEGHSHAPSSATQQEIVRLNTEPRQQHLVVFQESATAASAIAELFRPFERTVKVRSTQDFLFVESNGMPDHPMMIGITAWQQQVPLPKSYTGDNAWQIPLHPVPAKNPMSAKSHFFRGAIAVAVNGVPIFNPIKNDGKTDTLLAGELDQWGGHCGRADDYHYHIAPVHLEKIVGAGNAIAVALDGYPIYGYNDPNGKPPTDLDWLNGHQGPDGRYHYHATKTYPYLNGGFYGEVIEREGQVDPQPRAQSLRPALTGLKGAKITGYENPTPDSYVVHYDVRGDKRSVEYTVAEDGSATFHFVSPQGTTTETYTPRQRGGAGDGRRDAEPLRGQNGPAQSNQRGNQRAKQRGGRRGIGASDRTGGRRGPQPGEGPRQPWILVHADEIDLDKDKVISRDEIVGEATKAFAGYDANDDGQLSESELNARGGSRSAMGGFLKGHSQEIDRNGDGILSRAEAIGNAERMFAKMDSNGDGNITSTEFEAARRK